MVSDRLSTANWSAIRSTCLTPGGGSSLPRSTQPVPRLTAPPALGGSHPSSDTPNAGVRSPLVLIRDSPDESQTGINIRVFPAFLQDRREVLTATSTSGNPNAWSRV